MPPRPSDKGRTGLNVGANIAAVLHAASAHRAPNELHKLATHAEAEMKRMLSIPGAGRQYRRGSVVHTASAPGEPPAVDTGVYRSSWEGNVVGADTVTLSTADQRGPWLEYGTRRMLARPHLRPLVAMLIASGKIRDAVIREQTSRQRAEARKRGGRG